MMRKLFECVLVAVALLPGAAFAADTPVAEVSQLRMYSSFWQNLHHFLYVSAWATRPAAPGTRRLAMPMPKDPAVTMTAEEKATWDEAVKVYEREFASRDLLFDRAMTAIKVGLVDRDDKLTGAPFDDELRMLLTSTAPIYRKYWWPAHDAANRAWIAEAARRTTTYAPPIIARLTALYRVSWFSTPVRVDVVRAGKSQGAYTSNNPTHIVVASDDSSYDQWASTEMLFHESSHGLIQNVSADREHRAQDGEQAGERPVARRALLHRRRGDAPAARERRHPVQAVSVLGRSVRPRVAAVPRAG